jgi:hypothetical protein
MIEKPFRCDDVTPMNRRHFWVEHLQRNQKTRVLINGVYFGDAAKASQDERWKCRVLSPGRDAAPIEVILSFRPIGGFRCGQGIGLRREIWLAAKREVWASVLLPSVYRQRWGIGRIAVEPGLHF